MNVFELPSLKKGFVHFRFYLQSEKALADETDIRNRMEAFVWPEQSHGGLRNESGLGLAISKGLVSGYQGSLDVSCSAENGLEFITDVHFVLADGETERKKPETIDARKNLGLQGLRVLIAEDRMISILVARKLLESKGIKIDYVKSGKAAFQKFRESEDGFYSLILLELRMPTTDGYATAQMIRADNHPQAKTVPIIGMSENLMEDNEGKCLTSGMNGFIPKPIKGDRLLKLILSVMKNR